MVLAAVLTHTPHPPGEAVARLRPVEPVGGPKLALRWLMGIGGYLLLTASATTPTPAPALVLASMIAVPITRGRRGLIYRLLAWDVQDERAGSELRDKRRVSPRSRARPG